MNSFQKSCLVLMLPRWTGITELPWIDCPWEFVGVIHNPKRSLPFMHYSCYLHDPKDYLFKKILKTLVKPLHEKWCLGKRTPEPKWTRTLVTAWEIIQAQLVKHVFTAMSHLPRTLLGRKRPAEPKCSNSCNGVRDLWGTVDETIVFLHFPSPSHFAGQLGSSSPISVHAQSRCNCRIILFRFRNKHPP